METSEGRYFTYLFILLLLLSLFAQKRIGGSSVLFPCKYFMLNTRFTRLLLSAPYFKKRINRFSPNLMEEYI